MVFKFSTYLIIEVKIMQELARKMLPLIPNPKKSIDIGTIILVPEVPQMFPTMAKMTIKALPAYSILISGKNGLWLQYLIPSIYCLQ